MATAARRITPWLSAVAGALMSLFFIDPFASPFCGLGLLALFIALLLGRGHGLWDYLPGAGLTPAAIWGFAIIQGSPLCFTLPGFHVQSPPTCQFTPEVYTGYWEAIALFLAVALIGAAFPFIARRYSRTAK